MIRQYCYVSVQLFIRINYAHLSLFSSSSSVYLMPCTLKNKGASKGSSSDAIEEPFLVPQRTTQSRLFKRPYLLTFFRHKKYFVIQKGSSDVKDLYGTIYTKRFFYGIVKHLILRVCFFSSVCCLQMCGLNSVPRSSVLQLFFCFNNKIINNKTVIAHVMQEKNIKVN